MLVSIEHPSGEFTAELSIRMGADGPVVERAALLRTARRLFSGSLFVPRSVWDGRSIA
jgi:2-methylaconitate cis-trans-isomerase PrpF